MKYVFFKWIMKGSGHLQLTNKYFLNSYYFKKLCSVFADYKEHLWYLFRTKSVVILFWLKITQLFGSNLKGVIQYYSFYTWYFCLKNMQKAIHENRLLQFLMSRLWCQSIKIQILKLSLPR